MSGFKFAPIFLFALPILYLFAPSSALSDPKEKQVAGADKQSIVIKADSLEIDDKQKVVTFTGHVDARENDFVINCQKMFLYYTDQSTGRGPEKSGIKIDRIVATGGVTIKRPDGGLATAEEASYYQNDEKIVLTGNPVVKQGSDFVEGAKITLFIRENRSIVEGSKSKKVRAVYYPRSEKGVSIGQER